MESSNWKTKIVVGDVVKILLYYASRKVSEYIYTSENDAEQEARECTSHFCEILTKKGVLVSNIEKVGMFAEIATAFQAHQSATPSVTNVDAENDAENDDENDDEDDEEDDEDENNETTDENQPVIVEKKDNPRIIGQSFTTANLVQEILDNDALGENHKQSQELKQKEESIEKSKKSILIQSLCISILIHTEYTQNADVIDGYATYLNKFEIDIRILSKEQERLETAINGVKSRISMLVNDGWDEETARNFVFEYAGELNTIVSGDGEASAKLYFEGRGVTFNNITLLTPVKCCR